MDVALVVRLRVPLETFVTLQIAGLPGLWVTVASLVASMVLTFRQERNGRV